MLKLRPQRLYTCVTGILYTHPPLALRIPETYQFGNEVVNSIFGMDFDQKTKWIRHSRAQSSNVYPTTLSVSHIHSVACGFPLPARKRAQPQSFARAARFNFGGVCSLCKKGPSPKRSCLHLHTKGSVSVEGNKATPRTVSRHPSHSKCCSQLAMSTHPSAPPEQPIKIAFTCTFFNAFLN